MEAILSADPRQRDSIWAMVAIAFSALGDPTVLEALSPGTGGAASTRRCSCASKGTVYLLGTSTGASATAGIVAAFVEDVIEVGRRLAATSPGARLDPPLSLILDEAANYPLPSLPSLMSEGGGTGISTVVVLQSLAQARHVWGEHAASAIWDAAIVKVVLGGGSNARDLEDLSRLIGQREQVTTSTSRGGDGRRTTSTSTTTVPVLEPAQLRTLPFGTAVLLMRAAPRDRADPAPVDEAARRPPARGGPGRHRGPGPHQAAAPGGVAVTVPPADGYAALPPGPSPNPFGGGPVHVPSLSPAARDDPGRGPGAVGGRPRPTVRPGRADAAALLGPAQRHGRGPRRPARLRARLLPRHRTVDRGSRLAARPTRGGRVPARPGRADPVHGPRAPRRP